jgi:hypothetical protein
MPGLKSAGYTVNPGPGLKQSVCLKQQCQQQAQAQVRPAIADTPPLVACPLTQRFLVAKWPFFVSRLSGWASSSGAAWGSSLYATGARDVGQMTAGFLIFQMRPCGAGGERPSAGSLWLAGSPRVQCGTMSRACSPGAQQGAVCGVERMLAAGRCARLGALAWSGQRRLCLHLCRSPIAP